MTKINEDYLSRVTGWVYAPHYKLYHILSYVTDQMILASDSESHLRHYLVRMVTEKFNFVGSDIADEISILASEALED